VESEASMMLITYIIRDFVCNLEWILHNTLPVWPKIRVGIVNATPPVPLLKAFAETVWSKMSAAAV
jgi:hypothetical protein